MTLPARLVWGVKFHENVLHVMPFDVCFNKSWYRKLSFSYRNNIAKLYACYVSNRNGSWRMHLRTMFE